MPVFAIVITLVLLALDVIFLESWRRSVQKNGWNPLLYKLMYAVGALLAFIAFYYLIDRSFDEDMPSQFEKALSVPFFIWYLPKLVIVPVMMIKKLIDKSAGFENKTISLIRNKSKFRREKPIENDPEKQNRILTKRRKILKAAGWGIASAPFIIVTDGYARVTYNFRKFEMEIPIKDLPKSQDGLKIIQLSDLHAGSFYSKKPIEEAFRIVREEKPDMILITGDMVNNNPEEMKMVYNDLKKTSAPLGVYGCLGNHDHWMSPKEHELLLKIFKDLNIDLLINDNRTLIINGDPFQLAGTDNTGTRQNFADMGKTLKGLTSELPVVLMMHDPINWERKILKKLKIDLMLAGHTHGGQIVLDLLGEKITPTRAFYKHWSGLYSEGDQHLYVNRGFGTTGPPIRVGVPPEVTVITLRSKDLIS